MLTNLRIDARYDPEFLKELAGIDDTFPFGSSHAVTGPPVPGEVQEEPMQVIFFDEIYADAMLEAVNTYDEQFLTVAKRLRTEAINHQRDSLIEGGYSFETAGEVYMIQSAPSDRENVIGLALAAMGVIGQGATPGDLEWLVPGMPFGFIGADNRAFPLDAYGMMALYQRGLGFKMGVTLYARALKDACLAAADIETLEAVNTNDGWPE